MPTALPLATDFTGSAITESQFKTAITSLHDFLQGLLGTTGVVADAKTALQVSGQLQPIAATVAASALTISASALALDFRSTTLSSGAVTTVAGTPANLVVPSGATLGTANGVQSRLVVLALNNAGTIELAVVNIAGGNDLTETGLISTTAITSGASAANVIYSTTARTAITYRVVGYVESTQATAGAWATAPSLIQGQGGQALASMSSIGYGQTWQNLTASRSLGTTYYNTTGRPISLSININSTLGSQLGLTVNGLGVDQTTSSAGGYIGVLRAIVPPGGSYVATSASGTPTIGWFELR